MSSNNKRIAKILLGTSAIFSIGAFAYYYITN